MSVRLHVRKSHAGALKSDSVVKKKTATVSNVQFFLRALNFEERENVSEEKITRNAESSFRWILKGDTQGAWAHYPNSDW